MTTTMTLTMSQPQSNEALSTCPNCGTGLSSCIALDAQKQIEDLRAQVRLLNQKASAAVDKWADYEDEIHRLRAQQSANSEPANPSLPTVQNRLSSFLTARKSTPNLQAQASPPPPTPSEKDLVAALTREQALRQQAEGKLDDASSELEELSAQLFIQANEMVATERKARAKLEERVAILESRDLEKRKRLERLEGALGRIERVRGLLAPGK